MVVFLGDREPIGTYLEARGFVLIRQWTYLAAWSVIPLITIYSYMKKVFTEHGESAYLNGVTIVYFPYIPCKAYYSGRNVGSHYHQLDPWLLPALHWLMKPFTITSVDYYWVHTPIIRSSTFLTENIWNGSKDIVQGGYSSGNRVGHMWNPTPQIHILTFKTLNAMEHHRVQTPVNFYLPLLFHPALQVAIVPNSFDIDSHSVEKVCRPVSSKQTAHSY